MTRAVPYLYEEGGQVVLCVKVIPRASKNEIGEVLGNELKIKITAPPVDSAANEELIRFLARICKFRKGSILIVSGETSRHKRIRFSSTGLNEIQLALARASSS